MLKITKRGKVHGFERKICIVLFEMTDKTIAHQHWK
jgi:hypothetical protein